MKLRVIVFVIVFVLFTVTSVMAERYQAVYLTSESGVLILDAKEGHLWLWGMAGAATFLIYQGQLRPGKGMGEVTEKLVIKPLKPGENLPDSHLKYLGPIEQSE